MDYGNIFSRAWNICWNNKWIFVLGFLAALGTGGGNNANFNFDQTAVSPEVAADIERALEAAIPLFIALACAGVLIGIALWVLRLVAQAGMIQAAVDADNGRKTSLGQAFSAGTSYLLRFVGLDILTWGPFIVLTILLVVFFFVSTGATVATIFQSEVSDGAAAVAPLAGLALACAGLLLCLLLPLALVLIIVYALAQRSIVVEGLGVVSGFRRGWNVFRENLSDVLILAVLYAFIGFLFGLVVGLVLLVPGLLIAGPTLFELFSTGQVSAGPLIFAAVGLLVLGIIGAIVESIWVAFRSVSFTLAYQEMIGRRTKLDNDFEDMLLPK